MFNVKGRIIMETVVLTEGLFKDSQEKGKEYLLYLDIDRLVAPCYEAVGKEPRKPRYGGWEKMEIAGHSIGHWLSAAAMMYDVTGDVKLKEKIEYAVDELALVQSFDDDGYVSGFARDCFDEVFTGDFRVENFGLGGSWVPWYSIHKIYAGLVDAYRLARSNKALHVVTKLADWAERGLSNLTDEQFQRMLICEFGGMNEVMADIYELTNDERFLTLAERFNHEIILEPLRKGIDDLAGKHANTQFPKVIGAAKLYDLTKKSSYQDIVKFFWERVVYHRSYVMGGNSNGEHFGIPDTEPLGILTTETCNTYNMLKLTEHLFDWNTNSHYMDFYENGLYNHILASQDPDSGMKTYFVSTEPGHFKVYCSPDDSFWCCTGSGMENPARYAKNIYTRKGDVLYVNLFIPSKITVEDKEMQLIQETNFPYEQRSELVVKEANGSQLSLRIRVPYWLAGEQNVRINGKKIDVGIESGYLVLNREWSAGDRITFDLPMKLHTYVAKDDHAKQAFRYGPILLAGALGREQFPETDIVPDHLSLNNHPLIDVPVIVTEDKNPANWLHLIDKDTLTFKTDAIGQPGNQVIKMIPFYALHHERYTLYWQVMNEESFATFTDEERAEKEKLRQMTVDFVQPGEQQPETEHDYVSENSTTGYLNLVDRHWRDCRDEGYIQYEMKVEPNNPMYLLVTYFGSDHTMFIDGVKYERHFSIEVDQTEIITQTLTGQKPGELVDICYPIPEELTKGKQKVNITFRADKEKIAGGLYGVRMINQKIK